MDKNEMDEAYMQDAIKAAKAIGRLKEMNPEDAPAPVQQGSSANRSSREEAPSSPDAKANEPAATSYAQRIQEERRDACVRESIHR